MSESVLDYENPIASILYAEDTEPDWLLPGIIPQGTMVCLAGDAGAGKSYLSNTIALALASGVSALSGIIPAGEPRRVLYFDDENSEVDRDRYLQRSWHGLEDSHGNPPSVDLLHEFFIPMHFRLGDDDWYDIAASFIEHFQPALVVYDTAAACFNIQDENSNSEAAQVIKKIKRLMRLVSPVATSLVLRHANVTKEKGGKRTMRGAKVWKSQADQTMFQVRAQGRPRKGGLQLTRLVPDKGRAYALDSTIYITPSYTDEKKTGLLLEASYKPDADHKRREAAEEGDEDE